MPRRIKQGEGGQTKHRTKLTRSKYLSKCLSIRSLVSWMFRKPVLYFQSNYFLLSYTQGKNWQYQLSSVTRVMCKITSKNILMFQAKLKCMLLICRPLFSSLCACSATNNQILMLQYSNDTNLSSENYLILTANYFCSPIWTKQNTVLFMLWFSSQDYCFYDYTIYYNCMPILTSSRSRAQQING